MGLPLPHTRYQSVFELCPLTQKYISTHFLLKYYMFIIVYVRKEKYGAYVAKERLLQITQLSFRSY